MRGASAVPVVCAVLVLSGCQSSAADFTEADRAAVTALFDSTVATVRAKNWAGWAAQFTDATKFQPPNAATVTGRAAIQAFGEGFPPLESFAFDNVQVQGKGDLAWGTSGYTWKITGAAPDTGKQLAVFERDSTGTWKTIGVSFNSNIPLPAPPPPRTKQ